VEAVSANSHLFSHFNDHYHHGVRKAAPGIVPFIGLDRRSAVPLYRQLYQGFRDAVLGGRLRAGQRIPSTRTLAAELRVSRLPLLEAFEQLVAEGYFQSRTGSGTFVARMPLESRSGSRDVRHPAPARGRRRVPAETDFLLANPGDPWLGGWGAFRVSEPAVDRFPHEIWSRLLGRQGRAARRDVRRMHYGDPMGHRPFREAIAEYLRTARAVRCEAEQVMVVSGSQQALSLAARVLLEPGSPVWVEEPGYRGARDVFRLRNARLVPVPVDAEGLDVSAGMEGCPDAAAVYVTPSHQYPLGMVMSASRRLQLLDWARRSGSWIIEDDYDSEYRYESQPIASLQGLDRDDRVLYVGSFSKVLFPALRLGYLVLPPDLVGRFVAVRDATDIFPPTFPQAVAADFIREGHFARHLRRTGALYRERRGALVEALRVQLGDALEVRGDEAGMHLTAVHPGRLDDHDVAVRAARQGLWAMPLSSCYVGRPSRRGFVLGFAGTDAQDVAAGVRTLGALLRDGSSGKY
jgi:GntR family transcriptional regulator/MocR family aminotransferase